MDLSQNDADCPICYESINEQSCVVLDDCNHKFCESCTNELVFQDSKLHCPVDKKRCHFLKYRRHKKKPVVISIQKHKFRIIRNDSRWIIKEIERNWANNIGIFIKAINITVQSLYKSKKVFQEWFDRDEVLNTKEIQEFTESLVEPRKAVLELFPDIDFQENKIDIYIEYLCAEKRNRSSPTTANIINEEMIRILSILKFSLPNLKQPCLYYSNDKEMIQNLLLNIEFDIDNLIEIKHYVTRLIVSHISDNRDLYRLQHPNMDSTEVDKCLICMKIIDELEFASFKDCDHKICLDCTNKFVVSHGSCPFDGVEISDLKISSSLSSQYLLFHHQDNISKTLNTIIDFINPLIVQMRNIFEEIPDLFTETRALYGEIKKEILDWESIKNLWPEIRDLFEKNSRSRFIMQQELVIVRFYSYVSSFYPVMYKCVNDLKYSSNETFILKQVFHSLVVSSVKFLTSLKDLQDNVLNLRRLDNVVGLEPFLERFLNNKQCIDEILSFKPDAGDSHFQTFNKTKKDFYNCFKTIAIYGDQ